MLRDPVARAVSHYNYFHHARGAACRGVQHGAPSRYGGACHRMSAAEALATWGAARFAQSTGANLATARLLGAADVRVCPGASNCSLESSVPPPLLPAREALARCAVVGTFDTLPFLPAALSQLYGGINCTQPMLAHNANHLSPSAEGRLSAAAATALRAELSLDAALFGLAEQRAASLRNLSCATLRPRTATRTATDVYR